MKILNTPPNFINKTVYAWQA